MIWKQTTTFCLLGGLELGQIGLSPKDNICPRMVEQVMGPRYIQWPNFEVLGLVKSIRPCWTDGP